MRPETLTYFANLIEKELGIVYSTDNHFQLKSRLESVASAMGMNDPDKLMEQFLTGACAEARRKLIEASTNHETSFFRDARVFEAIRSEILPSIFNAIQPHEGVKIWSAACAYGQEPCTLAILIREISRTRPIPKCSILATDVAPPALERARTGIYTTLEISRGLPFELLSRYFQPQNGGNWKATQELHSMIEFQEQNLIYPAPMTQAFDLVLCRNILIYQRVENKAKIVRFLARQMKPGACLILGAGESLLGVTDELEQVNVRGVFLYRKPIESTVPISKRG